MRLVSYVDTTGTTAAPVGIIHLLKIWSRLLVCGLHVCSIRCRQLNILRSFISSGPLQFNVLFYYFTFALSKNKIKERKKTYFPMTFVWSHASSANASFQVSNQEKYSKTKPLIDTKFSS